MRTVLPRLGRLTRSRGLASYPSHTVLGLPALSPTMTSGNIAKYLVKVGDEIQPGDRIAEIETDKATVDFDVVDGGFVAKILIAEGTSDVPINSPMMVIADEAADVAAFADFVAEGEAAAAAPAAEPAAAAAPPAAAPAPAAPAPAAAAPAAAAPAAAPAAPVALQGGALPTMSGRIYWSEAKGWYRA